MLLRMTAALVWMALAACARPGDDGLRIVPQLGPVEPRRVEWSQVDAGRVLVLEASGEVGIWNVIDAAAPERVAAIPAGAIDATFAADGRSVVTAGFDGRVRWWASDGQPAAVSREAHASPARAVAAGADLVVSGAEDGTIRLGRPDGSPVGEPLAPDDGPVVSLAITPGGDILSVGGDGTLRRWRRSGGSDAAPSFESAVLYRQAKHTERATFLNALRYDVNWGWDRSVAVAGGGSSIAAALFDGALRWWNADGSLRAERRDAHASRHVRGVAYSKTSEIWASAGFDGRVRLWDAGGAPRGAPVDAHATVVYAVSFSPAGDRFATAGADNRVRLWAIDGTPLGELPARKRHPIAALAVAARAARLAVADAAGSVRIWDLDGTPRGGEPIAAGAIASLAFAPSAEFFASGGGDGSVRVYAGDGVPFGIPLARSAAPVGALAFTPDGVRLVAGGDAVRLLRSDKVEWERPALAPDSIRVVANSPDSRRIASGSTLGRLPLWNADGSAATAPWKLPREHIQALAFVPNGQAFASAGGSENVARLWNLDGTAQGEPLGGHPGVVTALASSADAGVLVSGSADGTVRLWRLPGRESATIAVGLPVDRLGFSGSLLWVRAGGDTIFFYDRDRRLVATALLVAEGPVVFTPDGWFAGPPAATRLLRVFDASGTAVPASEASRRRSPERVVAALARAAD